MFITDPNFPSRFQGQKRRRIHNKVVLTQNTVAKLLEIWSRMLIPDHVFGSQTRIFFIPVPGSRGQKSAGSRIRIRNTMPETLKLGSCSMISERKSYKLNVKNFRQKKAWRYLRLFLDSRLCNVYAVSRLLENSEITPRKQLRHFLFFAYICFSAFGPTLPKWWCWTRFWRVLGKYVLAVNIKKWIRE
jgi:hypothetical protein